MLFTGELTITPPLQQAQVQYLQAFSQSRRVRRNANIVANEPDSLRLAVELPIGVEGEYFVGDGSDEACLESIIDGNTPPSDQPSLYCCLSVNDTGTILLNGDPDNTARAVPHWIEYLVEHFFRRWNCAVNGTIDWMHEDWSQHGRLSVRNNVIRHRVKNGPHPKC